MEIIFRKIGNNYPFELLLLADETREAIEKYLYDSEVYIVTDRNGEETGVCVLFPIDKETVEIKNIAVSSKEQNKGIGTFILAKIQEIARRKGYATIIVGTADCGHRQIRFYENNGFVQYGKKENFFLENYTGPIYENGIMLKDMVMLRKEMEKSMPALKVEKAVSEDYADVMRVWESAVRATHDFLKKEDFEFFKKILPTDYLPAVDLYVLRLEGKTIGFAGVSGEHLEMLFISAEVRGKGYGKILLEHVVEDLQVRKVDVNEQNKQAVGFYEKFGFKPTGRSERDSMGKEYPILHLSL